MNSKSEKDKLMELKEMLIGRWILKNRSRDDWKEYEKRNDAEWIEREGLMILLTEEIIWSSSVSSRAVQCSLVRLCTLVSDRMSEGGDGLMGLRVLCWVVGWMEWKCRIKWIDETIDCVVNYLVKVIDECEEMEMLKWAILTGEKWWVEMKMQMSSERSDRLRTALTRHSQAHSDTLVGEMDRLDLCDAERYQVGWCARWCVDNVLEVGVEKIPRVKLSRDRFEARCDDFLPTPVRSPFPVKSNVYFYEVICVTNGEIELGWSTRKPRFYFIFGGNGKNSVMLQIGNQCTIDHNNHSHPNLNPPSPSPLNVFGCLLDVDNRRFEFYINGRALDCPITAPISHQPYFATVHLSSNQHSHFNFGQCPFKFPPRNIRFTTFHEQTGGDERKYRLMETKMCGGDFWFLHPPVDNQVSLFFDDEMQNEVNREVRRVEGDIENDRIGQSKVASWNIGKGWTGLRYMQAIIEVMGNVKKMDVMALWVGEMIEDVIDKVYEAKLLELLYPYLYLFPRGCTQSTLTQNRSTCIVLLHLIKCCRHYGYNIIQLMHSSVFTYLTRTLTSSTDHWTQLFVLIALADLEMTEDEKRQIEGCGKIGQIVETCREIFEGKDVGQLIKSGHKHRLQFQLYLCSQNLLNSITQNPTNANPTTHATLNPHDLTPQLTLSPCHLSARSDWHWQSVRSVCQVSAHIYYFEVVLLTAGPMTLGWATKRTDLAKFVVGGDEFSVGFNGYDRTIWNDNKEHPVSNISRWKAGDVIGCLLDHDNQKFTFYINGDTLSFSSNANFSGEENFREKINFTSLIQKWWTSTSISEPGSTVSPNTIYFSSLPYHACVSLSLHQQVYFNFGQTTFQYPPKRVDFRNFSLNPPDELNRPKPSISLQNVTVTSSLFTIDSQVNTEDITIQHISQPSTSNQIPSSSLQRSSSVTLCDICKQPQSTKRLRFECCDHLKFCLNCAHVLGNCRKCLEEKQRK